MYARPGALFPQLGDHPVSLQRLDRPEDVIGHVPFGFFFEALHDENAELHEAVFERADPFDGALERIAGLLRDAQLGIVQSSFGIVHVVVGVVGWSRRRIPRDDRRRVHVTRARPAGSALICGCCWWRARGLPPLGERGPAGAAPASGLPGLIQPGRRGRRVIVVRVADVDVAPPNHRAGGCPLEWRDSSLPRGLRAVFATISRVRYFHIVEGARHFGAAQETCSTRETRPARSPARPSRLARDPVLARVPPEPTRCSPP